MENMKIDKALVELKKTKERKFDQTLELIINLRKFDIRKNAVNTFITLPNKIKNKRICGFIGAKSDLIDTIPKAAFGKYKDKKELKNLVKRYDFFIASGPNMPSVATTFGRILGPAGKMPSPKLGIILNENNAEIKPLIERINKIIKISTKEASIKIPVGRASMDDNAILENIESAYESIVAELPIGKDNVKSVMIKFTMSKPIRVKL